MHFQIIRHFFQAAWQETRAATGSFYLHSGISRGGAEERQRYKVQEKMPTEASRGGGDLEEKTVLITRTGRVGTGSRGGSFKMPQPSVPPSLP